MILRDEPPILPRPPIWRRWVWLGAGVLAVVVVLVAALVVVPRWIDWRNRCAEGVIHAGEYDECVGITDGSFAFDTRLDGVVGMIKDENDRIGAEPSVSVVVMLPITVRESDLVTIDWVRHQLQGALLAQRVANRSSTWGTLPKIRLLLANAGSELRQWKTVMDELQRRNGEQIIAFTGIGLSNEWAKAAMGELSGMRMPIVGSTLTADTLSSSGIGGFARVSPTSGMQARTAAAFLKRQSRSAVVVRDVNQSDYYPEALVEQFRRSYEDADHSVKRVDPYDSSDRGWVNSFPLMVSNICAADPEVVYVAGRGPGATELIQALASGCTHPIKVVTGDDLALYSTPSSAMQTALEHGMSVYYTGLAHPGEWQKRPELFDDNVISHFRSLGAGDDPELNYPHLFPGDPLDDGVALSSHDAVATVAKGARLLAGPEPRQVTASDFREAMFHLNGVNEVKGASGPIDIDGRGDPANKPVPILQMIPGPQGPALVDLLTPDAAQPPPR